MRIFLCRLSLAFLALAVLIPARGAVSVVPVTGGAGGTNVVSVPIGNIVVLATNGSDTTGTRGRMDRPFRTLTNAMAHVQDGDTLWVMPGRYPAPGRVAVGAGGMDDMLNNPTIFRQKQNISIVGVGKPVFWQTNQGDFFTLSDCTNVFISGIKFEGSRTNITIGAINPWERPEGLLMMHGTNVDIRIMDCAFTNHAGFGINAHGRLKSVGLFVVVANCDFDYLGVTNLTSGGFQDGSALNAGGSHWEILGNRVRNCGRGIELFAEDITLRNIRVVGNTLISNHQRDIFVTAVLGSADILIADNYIEGGPVQGTTGNPKIAIEIDRGQRVVIRGNTITNMVAQVFQIEVRGELEDVQVLDNIIVDCFHGIEVNGVPTLRNVRVAGNHIRNIDGTGIYGSAQNGLVIEDNLIHNVGSVVGAGIRLVGGHAPTTNAIIRGNSIYDLGTVTTDQAISIDAGIRDTVIEGNLIYNTAGGISDSGTGTRINQWPLSLDGTRDVRILSGSGSPEGTITAGVGSIYARLDGGYGTTTYVKTNGTGTTGWAAVFADGGAGSFLSEVPLANVVVLSADGDDATAARGRLDAPYLSLTNALAQVQSGDTLLILPGRYPAAGRFPASADVGDRGANPVRLTNLNNVAIVGLGRPTLWQTNQGDFFTLMNCRNISFTGIRFEGSATNLTVGTTNPAPRPNALLAFHETNRFLTIRDCSFSNHMHTGISDRGVVGSHSDYVVVENCEFDAIGTTNWIVSGFQAGATISVGGSHWQIANNRMRNNGRGIHVTPSAIGIQNIVIAGNTLVSNAQRDIVVDGSAGSSDVRIIDNYIEGGALQTGSGNVKRAINVERADRLLIRGNTITNVFATDFSLRVRGVVNDVSILDNFIVDCFHGIEANGATVNRNTRIAGNHIRNIDGTGIYASGQDGLVIENNFIHNVAMTAAGSGIDVTTVTSSSNAVVRFNQIYDLGTPTTDNAIVISASAFGTEVYGNEIHNTTGTISDSGTGTRINEWTVSRDGTDAVRLLGGTGSPEGAVAASVGSIYARFDGGYGTSTYVKTNGTGNTGWAAVFADGNDGGLGGSYIADLNGVGTNTVNVGDAFSSRGADGISEQFGFQAVAVGLGSLAVGVGSSATGPGSVALGWSAQTVHSGSSAIGPNSSTTAENQVRLGGLVDTVSVPAWMKWEDADSSAGFAMRSVAVMAGSVTNFWPVTNALTGQVLTSDGEEWYWATPPGASGGIAVLDGFGTNTYITNGLFSGTVLTNGVTAPGAGINSEAYGQGAQASESVSVALGYLAWASADGAVAVGAGSDASGPSGVSIGAGTRAASASATAIGWAAQADHLLSAGIGSGAIPGADYEIRIGQISNSVVAFGPFKLLDADGSAGFALRAGAVMAANITNAYPTTNALAGQVLTSDGTQWYWSSGGGAVTGSYVFSAQFAVSGVNVWIADGAPVTNLNGYGTTALTALTASGDTTLDAGTFKVNAGANIISMEGVSEIQRFPTTTAAGGAMIDDMLSSGGANGIIHFITSQSTTSANTNQLRSWDTNTLDVGFDTLRGAWNVSPGLTPGVSGLIRPVIHDRVMEQNWNTNTITFSAPVTAIPLNTNSFQLLVATANVKLDTTNRPSRVGAMYKAVRIAASGTAVTVTNNASWRVYGSNTWTIPDGKVGLLELWAHGSTETAIEARYSIQDQLLGGGGGGTNYLVSTNIGVVTNVINYSTNLAANMFGWLGPTNDGNVLVKTVSRASNITISDQVTNLNFAIPILAGLTNPIVKQQASGATTLLTINGKEGDVFDAIQYHTNGNVLFSVASNGVVRATNGILTKEVTWQTNSATFGTPVTVVDMSTNAYQVVTLTGNTGIITTNRTAALGIVAKTVVFYASGADRIVTNNPNHRVYGTNTWFTVPSGKEAALTLWMRDTTEASCSARYDIQGN